MNTNETLLLFAGDDLKEVHCHILGSNVKTPERILKILSLFR